jgi:hypothetical protein
VEAERLCHDLATAHRRIYRNEAIEAQRVTPEGAAPAGPVALARVERKFVGGALKGRLGLDPMPADILMALIPRAHALNAGRQKGLGPTIRDLIGGVAANPAGGRHSPA